VTPTTKKRMQYSKRAGMEDELGHDKLNITGKEVIDAWNVCWVINDNRTKTMEYCFGVTNPADLARDVPLTRRNVLRLNVTKHLFKKILADKTIVVESNSTTEKDTCWMDMLRCGGKLTNYFRKFGNNVEKTSSEVEFHFGQKERYSHGWVPQAGIFPNNANIARLNATQLAGSGNYPITNGSGTGSTSCSSMSVTLADNARKASKGNKDESRGTQIGMYCAFIKYNYIK
jgi:hypothetical protein